MELVFNIWFIVDIGTDLSKYALLKPYCISGNDEEKTSILKNLAESDFVTCERFEFAKNINTVFENTTAEGYIHKNFINEFFDNNIDLFLTEVEKDLPPIIKFKGGYLGQNKVLKLQFPDNPLFVQTFLMENEFGEQKPYTTSENKEWYKSEKIRIDNKSKGIQN